MQSNTIEYGPINGKQMSSKVAALEVMKATFSHAQTLKISLISILAVLLAGAFSLMIGAIAVVIAAILIGYRMIKTRQMLNYLSAKYDIPLPQKNSMWQPQGQQPPQPPKF